MKIKCLIAVMDNGAKTLLKIVPVEFDTQAWANARAEGFNLLKIVQIQEEYL